MNIEIINEWGARFLVFAWPMLWQSSLLIALVFTLDLILARKLRAAVRYALWLTVLVKLLLPPTLALPTSAGWWLFRDKSLVETKAINYTVSYGDATPQPQFVSKVVSLAIAPKMDAAAWALLASLTISMALLIWLAVRWNQMSRKIRNASEDGRYEAALAAAKQQAGLRFGVRMKLVEGQMSPAVCGLLRPVILLPRALAETLSEDQLRAVLLHELFHLRRQDVWMNCVQALTQIFYWWHPLLWAANARIRRVREEAVDDAVMVALNDGSDLYAPTLVEVARMAFSRPRMSLGLVGIMESRSALRQRVERLVDFRAPRRAGLTMLSILAIAAFIVVAVPMGGAPAPFPDWAPAAKRPIQTLNSAGPQIHIKAVFIAGPIGSISLGTNDWTNSSWVMDGQYAQKILKEMKSHGGAKILAEPEILTIGGVHTQMKMIDKQGILTNYALIETSNRPSILAKAGVFEIGSVVDVVPHFLVGEHTISLRTTASVTDFLGYEQTNPVAVYTKAGAKIELPQVKYDICVRKASADSDLSDGQTVLLRLDKRFFTNGTEIDSEPDIKKAALEEKDVLVFITVTLVDAAGNRIHPNDESYYKYPAPDPISSPTRGGRATP